VRDFSTPPAGRREASGHRRGPARRAALLDDWLALRQPIKQQKSRSRRCRLRLFTLAARPQV